MRHFRIKAILISIITLGLYNDWVLGPFLDNHLSSRYSLISELSAQTQTHHWAFQILDISAGVLTLTLLPRLWQFLQKMQVKYSILLFLTIASIGVDSILDALLPIACAPSIDAQCSLTNTHSIFTQAHLVESTVIGVATFIAPLLWWWSCKLKQSVIARGSLWFVLLQTIVGVGILASRALGYNVTGIFQRAYQFGIGFWVVGILYIALITTATSRATKAADTQSEETDQVPAPTLATAYDE